MSKTTIVDGTPLPPRPPVKSLNLIILQDAALAHLKSSKINLQILAETDLTKPNSSYIRVKEGSFILHSAYQIVLPYKTYTNGKIHDKNIKKIDATLTKLGFAEEHLSEGFRDDHNCGLKPVFKSKGEGAPYYTMLSGSRLQLKAFINLVEKNINEPVRKLLEELSDEKAATEMLKTFTEDYVKINYKTFSRVDKAVEAIKFNGTINDNSINSSSLTIENDGKNADENTNNGLSTSSAGEENKKTNIFTNGMVMIFAILVVAADKIYHSYFTQEEEKI